jgi:hypothetical protein
MVIVVSPPLVSGQPVSGAAAQTPPTQTPPAQTPPHQTPGDRAAMITKTQRDRAVISVQQAALRVEKTVTFPITAEGMPEAVTEPGAPMILRDDDTLRVRNDLDRIVFIRLMAAGGPPDQSAQPLRVQALTAASSGGHVLEWSVADLKRIPGIGEVARVEVVPANAETEPSFLRASAYIRLGFTELTPEQLRTDGIPLTSEGPPATIASEETRLELRSDHPITLRNTSGGALRVQFVHSETTLGSCDGVVNLAAGESYVLTFACADLLAGLDRMLPFDVRLPGPPETALGTGYLLVPRGLLKGTVIIPIDVTGVADWHFLNPRSARTIDANSQPPTTLSFVSRVAGRTVIITFPAIKKELVARFREAGFKVKCARPNSCVPTLQLQSASRTVGGKLMIDAYSADEGLVQFRVAFFEGDIEPANPLGYFRVRPEDYEPGFSSTWNVVAFTAYQRDAYFEGFPQDTAKAAVINQDHSFKDQHRWHLAGNIRLIGIQQLGSRANGEVELVVKDKDFGILDQPTVTTQKARVNVFGLNDFILSVGRFDFAAPTRGLAISESGEGFMGRWRMISASFIVRPRDTTDVSTAPNPPAGTPAVMPAVPAADERWSSLAQFQVPAGPLRLEASGLIGRRKTFIGGEGLFNTVGVDLIVAGGMGQRQEPNGAKTQEDTKEKQQEQEKRRQIAAETLRADNTNRASRFTYRLSGGAYWSHRQSRASDVVAEDGDSGKSGLIDGALSKIGAAGTPLLTVGGTIAAASADNPSTSHDEGYVGESSAFGPDKIFLGTLAAKLAPLQLAAPDEGGQHRLVRRGISGKSYYSAGFTWHTFSPLYGILKIAQVPRNDVELQSTTIRWHGYKLRNAVTFPDATSSSRSWLGQELLTEFLLESPKAVRYSLTGGVFFPGELLKTQKFVTRATWLLDARVTVTLR